MYQRVLVKFSRVSAGLSSKRSEREREREYGWIERESQKSRGKERETGGEHNNKLKIGKGGDCGQKIKRKGKQKRQRKIDMAKETGDREEV